PHCSRAGRRCEHAIVAATRGDSVATRSPEEFDAERRRQMIAEAAYFRAQQRGFSGGEDDALRDWLEAEREIDERLRRMEIERFVERLEEVLLAANKKLSSLKRKVAGMKMEARSEWHEDIEKLTALR